MRGIAIKELKNPVQKYPWGSKEKIQSIIGDPSLEGETVAELWMGAHPKAPSMVKVDGDKWVPLNEIIENAPNEILGEETTKRFGKRLPFLFKLLAAERPLSIQVHPNLEQARKGFERENSLGIPLDAPERNYKDDNHKPEILCALSPFYALKGFRRLDEIFQLLERVMPASLKSAYKRFVSKPDPDGLKEFYTFLMTMDRNEQKNTVLEAVSKAENLNDPAYHWMITLYQEYPGDMGVFSPLLLNVIRLDPGEAIFVPAGELHSYLQGLGVELMANSDNVLRGGLTSKHVDVEELLRIVEFTPGTDAIVKPTETREGELAYFTPASEFLLSMITADHDRTYVGPQSHSVEILICIAGQVTIHDKNSTLPIKKGQSVLIPATVSDYKIDGKATLYKASVP